MMVCWTRYRVAVAALGLIASAVASPALAQSPDAPPTIEQASSLRAGSYIWGDTAEAGDEVRVIISIADQRAYVYRGAALIAASAVSTGARGHATPVGVYPILQKRETYHSNLYNNAPMPFMQRLTWDGVAMHGGHNPGYAASHGCVRLPLAFAKKLFAVTDIGAIVEVTADPIDLIAPPAAVVPPAVAMPVAAVVPEVKAPVLARADAPQDGGELRAIRAAILATR